METKRAQHARLLTLDQRQREVVIGSLLGDGHLTRTTRGYAFRVNHGIGQREYVDWKYRELESFTNSRPNTCDRAYYFRTVSHPYFDELRRMFYVGNRKIIPKTLEDWFTPLMFAVWFMDDGTRDGKQVRLNTQCFTRVENELLVFLLKAKLGIVATINRDKAQYRLRVREESMPRFRQLVSPLTIPSMRYKFSP